MAEATSESATTTETAEERLVRLGANPAWRGRLEAAIRELDAGGTVVTIVEKSA